MDYFHFSYDTQVGRQKENFHDEFLENTTKANKTTR